MIIDLTKLTTQPRHIQRIFPPEWWDEHDHEPTLSLAGPLEARFSVVRSGEQFVLEGRLTGDLSLPCSRCLETCSFFLDVESQCVLCLSPGERAGVELELKEEDMDIRYLPEASFDLDEMVREQVLLSIPMKYLCSEECLGLCPGCGENLNLSRCRCEKRAGHPAFERLKDLLEKGHPGQTR